MNPPTPEEISGRLRSLPRRSQEVISTEALTLVREIQRAVVVKEVRPTVLLGAVLAIYEVAVQDAVDAVARGAAGRIG